jgi:3-deoxy-D-manno-octulosonic-acid transferase
MWLYNFILVLVLILSSPYWIVRILFSSTWRTGFRQRLGSGLPVQAQPVLWLHAASVGEVKIAEALIRKIKQQKYSLPIVVSVITPTGFKQAKSCLAGLADVIFAPLDLPFIVPRAIKKINPSLLGIIETELWPNLMAAARKRRVKIILLNGRLSDRSYPKYQKFEMFFKTILRYLDYACVQSEEDKVKFIALGLQEKLIAVTSSIKYDFEIKMDLPAATIRREYALLQEDLVWVAGSTRNGEEALLLKAFQSLREKVPKLKLVLAPRHLERIQEVKKLLGGAAIKFALSSQVSAGSVSFDCLLIDTMGELMKAYSIADAVFIGGSLVEFGGQNILEPVALAKPVVCGPDMSNFKEITAYLLKQQAVIQVATVAELSEKIEFLLTHKEAARQMGIKARESLASKKGAVDKNVEALERLLAL